MKASRMPFTVQTLTGGPETRSANANTFKIEHAKSRYSGMADMWSPGRTGSLVPDGLATPTPTRHNELSKWPQIPEHHQYHVKLSGAKYCAYRTPFTTA